MDLHLVLPKHCPRVYKRPERLRLSACLTFLGSAIALAAFHPRASEAADIVPPVSPTRLRLAAARAIPQQLMVPVGTTKSINLSATDTPATFEVTSSPLHGSLQGVPPYLTYRPDSGYKGADGFTFCATTSGGKSAPAEVRITVTDWAPPVGIPNPNFGISEKAPATPSPWTAPLAPFYYIDGSQPTATDADNPYGYPGKPRKTIPSSLPAGASVELHGRYLGVGNGAVCNIFASGTAANPVFLRGASQTEKPLVTVPWYVRAQHLIIENIEFGDEDGDLAGGTTGKIDIGAPSDHVALRHSDIHGNHITGGIGVVSYSAPAEVRNVVIFDCKIHDNGDWKISTDQDVHAIAVQQYASSIWILDNVMTHNSGDGLQINGGTAAQATTHNIYVGRNLAYQNKQSGFWTKQAVDVIFSENTAHDHRPSPSSPGAGMGCQYAPERVWFLNNHIYDCDFGINQGSNSGMGFGEYTYVIGNFIHDIGPLPGGSFNQASAWSNAAIMLAGGVYRHIINNTIFNCSAGINCPGGNVYYIKNNIIASVTLGNHVFVETANGAQSSTLEDSLLFNAGSSAKIRWGSGTVYNLPAFQVQFAKGNGCVSADPVFADDWVRDVHLAPASPCVDKGVEDEIFSEYSARYGVSIAFDLEGNPRPLGGQWDMGAFER